MSIFTAEWVRAVRARALHPAFADARHALDVQTQAYQESLPAFPEQQAGYYHSFFCPQHAVQLIFDPQCPHRHVCPVDRVVFAGEPFDSAWLWSVNDVLSDAALKLAFRSFLYAESGHGNADRARAGEILLGYAERYQALPRAPGTPPPEPGHATWSALDESVWIIRLAWAYMLLGEGLPAVTREAIRAGLLQPATAHLLRTRRSDIHNITNWNNAALVTGAFALGDDALLDTVLHDSVGLRTQLVQGIRADGFWWEGSPSYHYYTLAALVWTMRILRASGRAFDDQGALYRMFRAPIGIALPDASLPAIHDCWYQISLKGAVGHGIPEAAGFYEIAFGWYADPIFAWVLSQNYAERRRSSFEALLDGASLLPDAPTPSFGHHRAVESGLVVLRTPEPPDRQAYLMLKAGPSVPGHGHPDQLSIQVFAHGTRLSPDLGTPGYGIGLNDTWYRQTASHNTVLLDGRSQPPAAGRINRFESNEGFALVEGVVSWDHGEYAGVQMRRLILWRDAYFIDLFLVDSTTPHQIDWVYHNGGEVVRSLQGQTVLNGLSGDCGYSEIADVRRIPASGPIQLAWRAGAAHLGLSFPMQGNGDLFMGRAPGNPATERLSPVIRRQTGSHAVFFSAFSLSRIGSEPVLPRVQWLRTDQAPYELELDTGDGIERWRIEPDSRVCLDGEPRRTESRQKPNSSAVHREIKFDCKSH